MQKAQLARYFNDCACPVILQDAKTPGGGEIHFSAEVCGEMLKEMSRVAGTEFQAQTQSSGLLPE